MSSQRVFGNTVGDLSNILKEEKLDRALQSVDIQRIQGIAVSEDFIYSLLQECFKRRDLNAGKQVHSLMISSGLSSVAFLGDHLIRLFAVCGSLADANQIFCNIPKPTTYTWNAIISAHEKLGKPEKALALYHKMQQEGSNPDRITILCVLKACSSLRATGQGKRIHDLVISSGLESDMLVGNMLVNMYAKCGNLDMACILFENLPNRDVVSWGALIGGYAQHGLGQSALELFERMLEEGIMPNRVIYLCTLKACGRIGDGRQGRLIHDKMISNGFQSDAVIGNSLIDMYTKCGSLKEAEQMFHRLPSRDVVSYTAMISGYAEHGPCFPALELFEILIKEGIKPNTFIFVCMLKICSEVGTLGKGRQIHNYICKIGVEIDAILGNTLLDMYVKCGSLHEACRIFDLLPTRNAVSWGILIAEYVKHGHGFLALESFEKMQEVSIKPNKVILLCVLKACSSIRATGQGKVLHDQIIRCGLDLDVVVGSTIVDMYAKCGSVDEAQVVFNKLPVRNVVSWGALIAGYAEHGHSFHALELFENMQEDGINPDKVTFLSILKACGSIHEVWQGRLIHEQIIRNECEADFIVGNALVDMYAKCGILEEACNVFCAMKNRDVVSWGALITGYVEQEHALHALELFGNMLDDGLKANKVIFLGILKACSGIGRIEQGRIIHEQILRSGLGSDVVVGSSLIDMYAKCGEIDEAHKVFDRLSDRNVVSWGAMIAGYVQHRCSLHAFRLLERMQQEGIQPNNVVFLCVLKACSSIEAIGQGRFIHDLITRSGLESDVYIGSTLVDIYAKCEKLEEAQKVFDGLPARNSVAWAAMITGYAMHGHDLLALHLFEEMEEEGIQPEKVTFLSVLKACGSVGAIGQGRQVHGAIIRCGLELDLVTGNSLVDMYASCGSVEEAQKVFDGLVARDIVSWGAMISGYARHGNPMQARQCLQVMQRENVVPDAVIFTSVLTACTQAGLLDEGRWYFNSMRHEYGITPTMEHFNCLVDLLGRAGHLIEAEELLQTMPILPDSIGWRSLLTACRTYGNLLLGGRCFDQIVLLDGNEASGYMLMSYMYADAHMWEDVEKMEQLRKCRIAAKKPGMAWIEVNDKLCEFVVGGTNHIQSEDIFYKLTRLSMLFKEEGHMPILNLVLNPLSLYSGAH